MPPAKQPLADVVDFDLEVKKRKRSVTKKFKAFGRMWKIQQANVALLEAFEREQTLVNIFAFIVGHVDESEREDFVDAIRSSPNMDMEGMMALMRAVERAAYPDIPSTPS